MFIEALKKKYDHKIVDNLTAFYHPQYRSRLIYFDECGKLIRFTRPERAFKDWAQLDEDNNFKGSPRDEEEAVAKFFTVEILEPPVGACNFDMLLKHCESIIHRHCTKFERGRHYELNYDDLRCAAYLKVHEEWLAHGHKPLEELEKIISTSIWNKFSSLLGKHFTTQSRNCGEMCSITENNENYMPAEEDPIHLAQNEKDDMDEKLISVGWGLIHRDIARQLLDPHPILRRDLQIQTLRYERIRKTGGRVPKPNLDVSKLKYVLPYSEESILAAYSDLKTHYKI